MSSGPSRYSVKPAHLPRLGEISNPEKDYLGRFLPLMGMDVLCIGYSEAEIDEYVAKYRPASITTLTLWEGHGDAQVQKYPLVIGDICKRTPFEDGRFDAVLSLSVLEHVHDLDGALAEMRRITQPGGSVGVLFGPAWSCAYGHHIFARNDPLLAFSRWEMPAFMHLLCEKEDLREYYLGQGYSEGDVLSVLHWFFESKGINRLPYDAYLTAFSRHFTLEKAEMMTLPVPADLLAILRARYGWIDFATYGGKYLLRV